jgi:hypothetical protein
MADLNSAQKALTVRLPAELIAELEHLAQEKNVCLDEVVREACIAYSEPYVWDRCYRESVETPPAGSTGQSPPTPGAKSA